MNNEYAVISGTLAGMILCQLFLTDRRGIDPEASRERLCKLWMASVFITFLLMQPAVGQGLPREKGAPALAVLAALLLAAAVSDIRKMRIPDTLVYAGAASGLLVTVFFRAMTILDAIEGSAAALLIALLVSLASKGGIGAGDVKLLGCAGIYLGLEAVMSVMLLATLLCGAAGIWILLRDRRGMQRQIPFAPFVWGAFILVVCL